VHDDARVELVCGKRIDLRCGRRVGEALVKMTVIGAVHD
jgi:hypothetical protein